MGDDHVGLQRDQLLRSGACRIGFTRVPAIVDSKVAAFDPSKIPKSVRESGNIPLRQWFTLGELYHYADAPNAVRLLGVRYERPCRRTAESGYKLPPANTHCHSPDPQRDHAHRDVGQNITHRLPGLARCVGCRSAEVWSLMGVKRKSQAAPAMTRLTRSDICGSRLLLRKMSAQPHFARHQSLL
jgi:hypothetical protein